MYEPLILRKRKPHTIGGTPTAKVSGIINALIITVPFGGLLFICHRLWKRKLFIAELNETDFRKKDVSQEYEETKRFWSSFEHSAIVTEVMRRYKNKMQTKDPSEADETNN